MKRRSPKMSIRKRVAAAVVAAALVVGAAVPVVSGTAADDSAPEVAAFSVSDFKGGVIRMLGGSWS